MNFLYIKEYWKICHGLHGTVFNIDNDNKKCFLSSKAPKQYRFSSWRCWWKQVGHQLLSVRSSSSCCTHDCTVKSSAHLQFYSWRVKHFFDSNWSGFQSTSERCIYSHCQTLNPLYVLQPSCVRTPVFSMALTLWSYGSQRISCHFQLLPAHHT